MTEEQRLNIQYKIIELLARRYYYFRYTDDEQEAWELARKDSYEIMGFFREELEKDDDIR